MSVNDLLQLCLDKAHIVFSYLPPTVQNYLSHPLVRKAIGFVAAVQLLRGVNRYLSQRAQNNRVRAQPWNAIRELVLVTGGSSGIGKQIVFDLVKLNVKTIIFDIQEPDFPLRELLDQYYNLYTDPLT